MLFLSALIIYASLIPICKGAKREPFGEVHCTQGLHCADYHHAGRAMPITVWSGLSSLPRCALLVARPLQSLKQTFSYLQIQGPHAIQSRMLHRYLHTKKRDHPLPLGDAGLCFTIIP